MKKKIAIPLTLLFLVMFVSCTRESAMPLLNLGYTMPDITYYFSNKQQSGQAVTEVVTNSQGEAVTNTKGEKVTALASENWWKSSTSDTASGSSSGSGSGSSSGSGSGSGSSSGSGSNTTKASNGTTAKPGTSTTKPGTTATTVVETTKKISRYTMTYSTSNGGITTLSDDPNDDFIKYMVSNTGESARKFIRVQMTGGNSASSNMVYIFTEPENKNTETFLCTMFFSGNDPKDGSTKMMMQQTNPDSKLEITRQALLASLNDPSFQTFIKNYQ